MKEIQTSKKGANILANVHFLKILPQYFKDVKKGIKPFEVRLNDRNYQVGDTLILEEYDPIKDFKTGAWVPEEVIYMLDDKNYVKDGFVILGIKEINFDNMQLRKRRAKKK